MQVLRKFCSGRSTNTSAGVYLHFVESPLYNIEFYLEMACLSTGRQIQKPHYTYQCCRQAAIFHPMEDDRPTKPSSRIQSDSRSQRNLGHVKLSILLSTLCQLLPLMMRIRTSQKARGRADTETPTNSIVLVNSKDTTHINQSQLQSLIIHQVCLLLSFNPTRSITNLDFHHRSTQKTEWALCYRPLDIKLIQSTRRAQAYPQISIKAWEMYLSR